MEWCTWCTRKTAELKIKNKLKAQNFAGHAALWNELDSHDDLARE